MNWLITGGCGFIGTSIVRRLLNTPDTNIRLVDNFDIGKPSDLEEVTTDYKTLNVNDINDAPQGIELVEGDIRNADDMINVAKGCHVIVHLAAHTGVIPSIEMPRHDMETNVMGTFNVLEAARLQNVRHVILASSGAALGKAPQPVNETRLPNPSSPYGAGKACTEMYASAYYHSFDIQTTVLRFSNVYGSLSKKKNSIIAKFIKQGLREEPLTVFGDGNQLRDYIYIDDLINIVFAVVEKDMGGEIFQVATQVETPVSKIAEIVQAGFLSELGKQVEIVQQPGPKGDEARVTADISKARDLLGFEPSVALPEGVRATIKYFNELETPKHEQAV